MTDRPSSSRVDPTVLATIRRDLAIRKAHGYPIPKSYLIHPSAIIPAVVAKPITTANHDTSVLDEDDEAKAP